MGETSPKTLEIEDNTENGQSIVLKDLKELSQVPDEALIETFTANVASLFEYNRNDLQQIIEPRDLSLLKDLRAHLSELLQSNVTSLANRPLVIRRIKTTVLNDICLLGLSICKGSLVKDADKIYQAENSDQTEQSSTSRVCELNCGGCFAFSSDVKKMIEMQNETLQAIHSLNNMNKYLSARLDDVSTQLNARTTECFKMSGQVSTLQGEVTKLTREFHSKIWQNFANKKSLLLGDDIICDIDAKKLVNTEVVAKKAATVKDLACHLTDDSKVDEQYRNILFCMGSNDCLQNTDIDETRRQYKDMVTTAISKVQKPNHVIISSIPPRLNDTNTQSKIECLNAALAELATDTGAKFVNNEESFTLRNGQVNDGYLQTDGDKLRFQRCM